MVLARGGQVADRIRKRFDRPLRWRWLNGSRRPDLLSSQVLEELSDGEVPMNGWYTPEEIAAYRSNGEAA